MQVDLYTTVHKAQRFHLFRFAESLGRTNFENPDEIRKVEAELHHLLDHLKDHADNEEKYIHPLYHKIGGIAETLDAEHRSLHIEISKLEKIAAERKWYELYGAYNHFLGEYLIHLAEEEKMQRDVLWKNFSNEDLLAVFNHFKAERSPAASKADLVFMLPALSVPELARMYQGMKAGLPEANYRMVYELAEKTLDPAAWNQLRLLA